MRWMVPWALVLVLLNPGRAADAPSTCGAATACTVAPADLKAGRKAFERGIRLRDQQKALEALDAFRAAAELVPGNVEYVTAREIALQQAVLEHLTRGNGFLAAGKRVESLAEFRQALELDPRNDFALQRLRDAAGDSAPGVSAALRVVQESQEIELAPRAGRADFKFRGDGRVLVEQVAAAFGVRAVFDESFQSHRVRVDLQQVDFVRGIDLAMRLNKSFWSPLSGNELLVAADNPENRRRFQRMSMRTFYLSDLSTPQQLNEVVGMLRGLFDMRLVYPQPSQASVTVRAPKESLDAATRFLEALSLGAPQVMLEVQAYEVNRTMLRNLGVELPLQFQMFHLSSAALALAGTSNIQELINQLIAQGGINQASSQTIAALLAQLQNQSTLFSTPFATFGGGNTLFGVTIPSTTANVNFNESRVRSLQQATLRASQNNAATFRVGSRFPILNASFAPIFNSPALSRVVRNQSYTAPFPSFTYEDLGLTLKATPQIHGTSEVTLQLEVAMRALGGQALNGVPVLTNREFKSAITVANGATAVLVGNVSSSEQTVLRGMPGIGQIPGLGRLTNNERKEEAENELLVLITPHIVRPGAEQGNEVWLEPAK